MLKDLGEMKMQCIPCTSTRKSFWFRMMYKDWVAYWHTVEELVGWGEGELIKVFSTLHKFEDNSLIVRYISYTTNHTQNGLLKVDNTW